MQEIEGKILSNFYNNTRFSFMNFTPPEPIQPISLRNKKSVDTAEIKYIILILCLNYNDNLEKGSYQFVPQKECWINLKQTPHRKIKQKVIHRIQSYYSAISPSASFYDCSMPNIHQIQKVCREINATAQYTEKVLIHYNGHGVPPLTSNGSLWIFNEYYTRYFPLPITELVSWLQIPSLFLIDANKAARAINFLEYGQTALMSCDKTQLLPMDPLIPSDLFTVALLTPLKAALYHFLCRSSFFPCEESLLNSVPGSVSDPESVLGQLYCILSCILHSVAWLTFPIENYLQLFLLTKDFQRKLHLHFILAHHLCRSINRHPKLFCGTEIRFPQTFAPCVTKLWREWEHIIENIFLLGPNSPIVSHTKKTFFQLHLNSFENWISINSLSLHPPDLIIVLKLIFLCSSGKSYREEISRALELLCRFLDKGIWAIKLLLSLDFYSNLYWLLKNFCIGHRDFLIFICAKILSVDLKFVSLLHEICFAKKVQIYLNSGSVSDEKRIHCFYILSAISPRAKMNLDVKKSLQTARRFLCSEKFFLRWWCLLSLSRLWCKGVNLKEIASMRSMQRDILLQTRHYEPTVRACAVYVIGSFVKNSLKQFEEEYHTITFSLCRKVVHTSRDGSALVRMQLVILLYEFVVRNLDIFVESTRKLSQALNKNILEKYEKEIGSILDCIRYMRNDPFSHISKTAKNLYNFLHTYNKGDRSLSNLIKLQATPGTFSTTLQNLSKILKPPSFNFYCWSESILHHHLFSKIPSLFTQSQNFSSDCKSVFSKSKIPASLAVIHNSLIIDKTRILCHKISHCTYPSDKRAFHKINFKTLSLDLNASIHAEKLEFHPFRPLLFGCDSKNFFHCWNLCDRSKNVFHLISESSKSKAYRVTDFELLNYSPNILCTSYSNGVIKLWKYIESKEKCHLLTGFLAIDNLSPQKSFVISQCLPFAHQFIATGSCNSLHIWDIKTEQKIRRINTLSKLGIQSTCVNESNSHSLIFTGCGRGEVSIFDLRLSTPLVYSNEMHTNAITNLCLHSNFKLFSAASDDRILLSDIRYGPNTATISQSNLKHRHSHKKPISKVAVHPTAQLYAFATKKNRIKLFDFEVHETGEIKPWDSYIGAKNSTITALKFHPTHPLLAAADKFSKVQVYATSEYAKEFYSSKTEESSHLHFLDSWL